VKVCLLSWAFLFAAAVALASPREAPDFALPTPDGRVIRLAGQRNKVVVLEFLQTGCPRCQECGEMLQKIYDAKAARGLEVIGISHDQEGFPAIREYQFQHRLTYPVVLGDLMVAVQYVGATPDKPSFEVPVFIFIDRQGRIVEERRPENPGDREWFAQLPASLEALIESLLGPEVKPQVPVPGRKSRASKSTRAKRRTDN